MSVAILRLVAGVAVTIFGLYLMSRFKSEAYGGYSPRNRWPLILFGLAVAICGIALVG
jgi:hypothetical protein